MTKKILFFCGGSYVAGMEIITLFLISGLKKYGYDVRCVVNGWNDGDFKKRLTEMNVPYYEVKLGWLYWRKLNWTFDTLKNYPWAYYTCRKVLKEFKPDIVNFTNYTSPIMLYPLIKKNSFYTLHDTHLPNLKHRLIYKLLKRRIGKFIGVSNHISDTLVSLAVPKDKITTIYNGIAGTQAIENLKANPNAALRFAIIGQVTKLKGHEVLINAAELLVKSGVTNFNVVVIGNNENPYGKLLMGLIEAKKLSSFFCWRGFIKNVETIYEGIDVVVVPSICTEAFSLTTAESMIRGLTVIASNDGALKELITNRVNGLLFKQGDADELHICMAELIQNKASLKTLGNSARKKAVEDFSVDVMIESYIRCYETNKR